jgi:hypothetical protein
VAVSFICRENHRPVAGHSQFSPRLARSPIVGGSLSTLASSTLKLVAMILLKVALNTKNQSIVFQFVAGQ